MSSDLEIQDVITMTREGKSFHYILQVATISGEIKKLISFSDRSKLEADIEDLSSGIVLFEKQGRKVLTLIAEDFDSNEGGEITFRYLHDGGVLKDKYEETTYLLQFVDGEWLLGDEEGSMIKTLHFTNHFYKNIKNGMVNGIDQIQNIYA